MFSERQKAALTANGPLIFVEALGELANQLSDSSSPNDLLAEALTLIGASLLNAAEQSRRATMIIRKAPFAVAADRDLLARLAQLPVAVKTGVANGLPPESLPV